jgi:hypothetical protein
MRRIMTLTTIFYLLITLVRLWPRDDAVMRNLVLPPDCPPPCFLGVQPSVTTGEAAIATLEAHPWITRVRHNAAFYDLEWSSTQPDFIDNTRVTYLFAPDDRVTQIRLRTTLPLGAVIAMLGQPTTVFVQPAANGFYPQFVYPDLGLEVSGYVACDQPLRRIWHTPVEMRLYEWAVDYSDSQLNLVEWWRLAC